MRVKTDADGVVVIIGVGGRNWFRRWGVCVRSFTLRFNCCQAALRLSDYRSFIGLLQGEVSGGPEYAKSCGNSGVNSEMAVPSIAQTLP